MARREAAIGMLERAVNRAGRASAHIRDAKVEAAQCGLLARFMEAQRIGIRTDQRGRALRAAGGAGGPGRLAHAPHRGAYSTGLVLLGVAVAALQLPLRLEVSRELLLAVLLPGLVFEAAYRTDARVLISTLPAVTLLDQLLQAAVPTVAALAALLVSRALAVYLFLGAGSRLAASAGWATAMPHAWLHLVAWSGLRGAVAVALALSLPPDLPNREMAQGIVFGCVLMTMLLQGSTAGPLVPRLGLERPQAA